MTLEVAACIGERIMRGGATSSILGVLAQLPSVISDQSDDCGPVEGETPQGVQQGPHIVVGERGGRVSTGAQAHTVGVATGAPLDL